MEHEQAAEVRSRAGLTDAGIPKRDRRRVSDRSLCPHTTAYEKSGHCRIEEIQIERKKKRKDRSEDSRAAAAAATAGAAATATAARAARPAGSLPAQ